MAKSRRRVQLEYRLERELTAEEIETIRRSVGTFRSDARRAEATVELPASEDGQAKGLAVGRLKAAFNAAKVEARDYLLESATVERI